MSQNDTHGLWMLAGKELGDAIGRRVLQKGKPRGLGPTTFNARRRILERGDPLGQRTVHLDAVGRGINRGGARVHEFRNDSLTFIRADRAKLLDRLANLGDLLGLHLPQQSFGGPGVKALDQDRRFAEVIISFAHKTVAPPAVRLRLSS